MSPSSGHFIAPMKLLGPCILMVKQSTKLSAFYAIIAVVSATDTLSISWAIVIAKIIGY